MSSAQKVRNHFRSHWSYPCFWSALNGGSTEFSRRIPTCKSPTYWGHSLLLSSWPYSLSTPQLHLPPWHHRNTNTICSNLKQKIYVSLPFYFWVKTKPKKSYSFFLWKLFYLHSLRCHFNHTWLFSRSFYALKPMLKNNVIVITYVQSVCKNTLFVHFMISFRLTYVVSKSSSHLTKNDWKYIG